MEPLTHALTSLSLANAGFGRLTRRATPMLLVSGLAADLDWLSYVGGARMFLTWHRTATHSLIGTAFIAVVTAAAFAFLPAVMSRSSEAPAAGSIRMRGPGK